MILKENLNIYWLAIKGRNKVTINYENESITYLGENEFDFDKFPYAIVKSREKFAGGNIIFKIKFDNVEASRFEFVFNQDNSLPNLRVGFSFPKSNSSSEIKKNIIGIYKFSPDQNSKWVEIPISEPFEGLNNEQWYNVRMEFEGSFLRIFVDDILICKSSDAQIGDGQVELWFSAKNKISIEGLNFSRKLPKAFIVMQFSAEFNALFNDVIKPVCESFGYECVRADNIYNQGLIIQDIIDSINLSTVIVADVTVDNPNVFYEVGYAHALRKPTILLSDRKREKMPFDISGFRTLFYDNSIGGKNQIEIDLKRHLSSINNQK